MFSFDTLRTFACLSLLATGPIAATGCDRPASSPPDAGSRAEADPSVAQPKRPDPDAVPARLASTDAAATPKVDPLPPGARTQDERNTIDVFEAAAPATVFVTQSQVVVDRWSMRATEVPAGAGTGFVWDKDGHIVTNCHVVLPDCRDPRGRPPKLEVRLFDQKDYPAKLVGWDPAKDIAVLEIDAPAGTLTPIRRPPDKYDLVVGQKTIAIGNPFGLDHTLTVGVVSALGREVKGVGGLTIRDVIQTDAAINPGNSGGPLLDSTGQLIGMNTMIFSLSGSSAGIGFAVPYTTIERLVPQLIRSGHAERVGLMVQVIPDRDNARLFGGLPGVIIRSFDRGSPAHKAGLQPLREVGRTLAFDLIVGIEDKRVRNFDDLYSAFEGRKAGDTVQVMIRRFPKDEVITAEVELARLE